MKRIAGLTVMFAVACSHAPAKNGDEAKPSRVASRPDMTKFLEQYATTYRFRLGQPSAIKFTPDGTAVLYLRSGPRSFVGDLYQLDLASKEERVLLTADQILAGADEELSEEERARRERMRSTARGIASYALSSDGTKILVPLSGRLFVVERESGKITELESQAGYPVDPVLSPAGDKVACVRDGDLYVIDIASGAETRLTKKKNEHESNGLAEFVAQEEMSRFHGFWWSPDGREIVFQTNDTSKLETMHIMDPMNPAEAPRSWPYPRPGKDNAEVRLSVIGADGKNRRSIAWDHTAYPYLNTVRWKPNAPLTLVVQNRTQTEQLILTVDEKQKTHAIHKETDAAWLNIDQAVPRWLADGKQFLWATERAGAWQLELRAADGQLVKTLTEPSLGYIGLVDVDEPLARVVVRASGKQSEEHIYAVALDGKTPPEMLSAEPGIHSAVWAPGRGLWVHSRSTLAGTRDHRARTADGNTMVELNAVTEAPVFEPNVEVTEVEGAARSYSAAIIRPRDFDADKKYPVFVYVYAGPGFGVVKATPYAYMLSQWFADHGFIVVSIDGRGTPGKGREWERAIKGNFIDVPLADQADGLKALGERYSELDLARVGVFGWSFGGYFSCMAVMQRPDVFHAGVAGAPVTDWLDYDTHYTERFLGLPEAAPEAYDVSSVLKFAPKLERPLLVMHGTADDNVYFSHAIKLTDALFRAGKKHDFLPLSGFTHMVPDPLVTTRLYTTIVDYFIEHLKPE